MRVLVSGYYGFGNVGDEAVLEAIIHGLCQRLPEIEITVLSASPEITEELNRVKSIHRYDWFKILSELWKADVFLSGGGTLFQNVTSRRSFWYYLGLVFLAMLFRKKTAVFAQGFGPLRGKFNRAMAKWVLNRVNLITVRDADSFADLQKLGITRPPVHLTADPSVVLNIPQAAVGQRILSLEGVPLGRKLLGVSIRNIPHRRDIEEKFFPLLAQALDYLVGKFNYLPVFIPFRCPEDIAEAMRVINLMKESSNVVFRMCHPGEMLGLVSQLDFLIGMRLHSLIFAAISGVPLYGLSYDPKVEAFMKSIEQPCLKIDAASKLEGLTQDLEKIISSRETIRNILAAKRKMLYDKAVLNFDLFFNALTPHPPLPVGEGEKRG